MPAGVTDVGDRGSSHRSSFMSQRENQAKNAFFRSTRPRKLSLLISKIGYARK